MNRVKTIGKLGLLGLLGLLLLSACYSYDEEQEKKAVLTIYVYPPSNPMITRDAVGNITSSEEEKKIHSLQIWIFVHDEPGQKVAYLNVPTAELPEADQGKYEIELPVWFTMSKPNVDVYVVANVTTENCGFTLHENTTKGDLETAVIRSDYFGLTNPVNSVPAQGLPMTGMLKNQPISGEAPTLRVGTSNAPATVRLMRITSRVRFVFGRPQDANTPKLTIKEISLAAKSIPDVEYLMPDEVLPYHLPPNNYNTGGEKLWKEPYPVTTSCPTPSDFIYEQSGAQDYEDLVAKAITNGELSALPPFYLRESDKIVNGTIKYEIDNKGTKREKTAEFFMENAGDFARDHSWLVYAFYTDEAILEVISVRVKPWQENDTPEYPVPNW